MKRHEVTREYLMMSIFTCELNGEEDSTSSGNQKVAGIKQRMIYGDCEMTYHYESDEGNMNEMRETP